MLSYAAVLAGIPDPCRKYIWQLAGREEAVKVLFTVLPAYTRDPLAWLNHPDRVECFQGFDLRCTLPVSMRGRPYERKTFAVLVKRAMP